MVNKCCLNIEKARRRFLAVIMWFHLPLQNLRTLSSGNKTKIIRMHKNKFMIKRLTSARKSNLSTTYLFSGKPWGCGSNKKVLTYTDSFWNKFIMFDEYITSLLLASGPAFILSFSLHNVVIHMYTVISGSMDLSLKPLVSCIKCRTNLPCQRKVIDT